MAFGEFEWQTEAIMQHQISVNFLGTVMLTHSMLPLIRQDQGRIVTVTSHCGIETLPGEYGVPFYYFFSTKMFYNYDLPCAVRVY